MDFPVDTASFYSPAAENLVAGKTYGPKEVFSDRYPPLFPLFLAAVYGLTGRSGESNTVYPFLAALVQAFNCGLIFLIARRFLPNKSSLLAAAICAACPFFAVLSVTRYAWTPMPLFMLFFLTAVYFALKAGEEKTALHGLFSGTALGLSCLVWPAPLYLWTVFAVYLLLKRAPLRAAAAFIPAFFVPILIWSSVVFGQTGHFRVSGGQLPSMRDGMTHAGPSFSRFEFVREARIAKEAGGLENKAQIASFTLERARKNFSDTFAFFIFKFFRPLYATDSERYEKYILAAQVPFLALALAGFCRLREKKRETLFLAGIFLYFWLTAFAVLPILRYMTPAMSLFCVFAAAAFRKA